MIRLLVEGARIRRGGRTVLDGIDLGLAGGEIVGLLGPNGAGKSSLLRALAGIDPVAAGTIRLGEEPVARVPRAALARRIGFLPQPPEAAWPLPVHELVALGRLPHRGRFAAITATDRAAIERAMQSCDVLQLRDRTVTSLSAGEAARVFLARALAGEPEILLVDEPTANLDPAHQIATMAMLRRLSRTGVGVLVAQHDMPLAARYCDRLVLLGKGAVLAQGAPRAVLTPENLDRVFGVTGWFPSETDDAFFALPWSLVRNDQVDNIVEP